MNAPGFRVFTEWKRAMLSRRGLEADGRVRPDGRPLYRYRLTQEEFDALENLLKTWVTRLNERANFALIAGKLSGFPALFVLYAAEWWRRRYAGGPWAWEPILKDIGADPDEWSQQQRSDCVSRGLQDWGLRLREDGGLRYLGSVAVQGGLPVQLLAQARGGVGQILKRVLQLAADTPVGYADILEWVRSLQHQLPRTYRQDAIYSLLTDVAWCVLVLKVEAKLESSATAIEQLDRSIPNWRERFPLLMDDAQARGLIEQLVRDVATASLKKTTAALRVIREIQEDGQNGWRLSSRLDLPVSVTAQQLAGLFDITTIEELPRLLELTLTAGGYSAATTLRRLSGTESYRIERQPWEVSGDDAAADHILHLRCADGRAWWTVCPLGEALEEDLPWVFSAQDGIFLRQGSGDVAVPEVHIIVPAHWRCACSEYLLSKGRLGEREVLHVRGSISLRGEADAEFRVKTAQASASEGSYILHGERLWLDFLTPRMAFKGSPQLYRIDQDGVLQRAGTPGFSYQVGPTTARYPAQGPLQYRSRLLLLPTDARLELEGQDARRGTIHLRHWQAMHCQVVGDDIEQRLTRDGPDLHLQVTCRAQRTPERVELEVSWPQGQSRLFVPFPAKGVRAYGAQGEDLSPGARLPVHDLLGVRFVVMAGHRPTTIELCKGAQKILRHVQASPGMLGLELRLLDYLADIQRLLACDDGLDAAVQVMVRIGEEVCFEICITRYAARMETDATKVRLQQTAGVSPEKLAKLSVLALRLERPGDEAVHLEGEASCGVPTGVWDFSPGKREPGNWLIYPGKDAAIPFRPLLWPVEGEIKSDSPLAQAMGLADQRSREAALDRVILAMAMDFMEPCWSEVERLVGHIGHLPLPTLDLWRRFARSPDGMAALALRFSSVPMEFIDRFNQELPFAWETIPFGAWRMAVERLQEQCRRTLVENAGEIVFPSHLKSRVQDIQARHGTLAYLLGLSCAGHRPDSSQEIKGVQALGGMAKQRLFEGEDSHLMALRRRHAEDEWPTGFNDLLNEVKANTRIRPYLCPESYGYCDGVINLPLLLAAQVAIGQTSNWFGNSHYVQVLRNHYAFDPEWFEDAYNLTIARCLADGLILLNAP